MLINNQQIYVDFNDRTFEPVELSFQYKAGEIDKSGVEVVVADTVPLGCKVHGYITNDLGEHYDKHTVELTSYRFTLPVNPELIEEEADYLLFEFAVRLPNGLYKSTTYWCEIVESLV